MAINMTPITPASGAEAYQERCNIPALIMFAGPVKWQTDSIAGVFFAMLSNTSFLFDGGATHIVQFQASGTMIARATQLHQRLSFLLASVP